MLGGLHRIQWFSLRFLLSFSKHQRFSPSKLKEMKVCLCSIPTTLLPCIRVLFICEITFYILIERTVYNAVVPLHVFLFFYHLNFLSFFHLLWNIQFTFWFLFSLFFFIRWCILWSPQPLISSNLNDKHRLVCFMCQNQAVCWLICFCSFFYSQESRNGHLKHTLKIPQCTLLKVPSLNLQTLNVMLL